jgi:hypothetical protein
MWSRAVLEQLAVTQLFMTFLLVMETEVSEPVEFSPHQHTLYPEDSF